MPGSDDESGVHNVLVSSIKQEPVDWIIEENINSDEDDVSSNHVNKYIKKELDETVVTKSPPRSKLKRNCKSKQIAKAARFNSLIANLKEKALSKQTKNETVIDNSSQNTSNITEQYHSTGVLEGKDGSVKIKEEHNDFNDSSVGYQNCPVMPPQTCTTSVGSLTPRISKETVPLQNTRRISDLTLRNMLNHVPTIITNMTCSDALQCRDNDSKAQQTFSDKTWLPRLTELIKSKPKTPDNGEEIKVSDIISSGINTKYKLLKDLVFQRTEQMLKVDENKESCKRMLTSKTLSSLLAGKIDDPKPNTEPVVYDHYDCQECKKTFGTFASLIAHKKYHRLKQKLVCPTCKKEFSVKRDFERHLKEHNTPEEYTCSVCEKNFSVIGALKRHLLIHRQQPTKEDKFFADDLYGEGVEDCPVCGDKFSKYYIKYHMKIHSSDRPYTCKKCDKSFTHKQSLVAHRLKHKRESVVWKCKFCDRVFDYEYLLKRHMKLHTKYKCDKCDKTLRNKASYLSHWRTHNTSSYQCDVCNRTYSRYSAYFSHYQSHKDIGHVPLPENTGTLIPESSGIDDLTNTNIDKSDDQILNDQVLHAKCSGSDLVNRVIAEKYDFNDPVLVKVQPAVYNGENESVTIPNAETGRYSQTSNTCPVCKWDAISPCALKRHMRVHEPKGIKRDKELVDKLYKEGIQECPVCGDKFSKYYIKYHIRIHSSVRPYSCDKCEKAFAHKSSLVAHVLTHQRESLVWYCDFCERGFEYEYLFKRHMKNHSSIDYDTNVSKKIKNVSSLREALEMGVSSETFLPEPSIEIDNVEEDVENVGKDTLINKVISSILGDMSNRKDNSVTGVSADRMEYGLPDGHHGGEYSINNDDADKCDDEQSDSFSNAEKDKTFIDCMLNDVQDGVDTVSVKSEDQVFKNSLHPEVSSSEKHLVPNNLEVLTSEDDDFDNDIDLPVQFGTG